MRSKRRSNVITTIHSFDIDAYFITPSGFVEISNGTHIAVYIIATSTMQSHACRFCPLGISKKRFALCNRTMWARISSTSLLFDACKERGLFGPFARKLLKLSITVPALRDASLRMLGIL